MPSAQHNQSFSAPGYSFNSNEAAVTADSNANYEVPIAAVGAVDSGTLTTRTGDTSGVATLNASHTIETADVVDVYWDGGVRYGMDATKSGAAVTVDGGGGDVFPSQDTAVTVVVQTEINPLNVDGDNVEIIGVFYRNASDTGAKAHIDFQDVGDASINELDLVHETAQGGLDQIVNVSAGDTNTYTGNPVTKGFASHDSASAGTLYVCALIDSTP